MQYILGSIITKEDLMSYTPQWLEPLIIRLPSNTDPSKYTDIAAMPPPSSGALVTFIMKTLNGKTKQDLIYT